MAIPLRTSFDVVLTDAHLVFLDALSSALRQLGYRVMATASTYRDGLESIKALRPDLWVLEWQLSDEPNPATIDDLTVASPRTKVVVLSADNDSHTVRQALDRGATAYVHKSRGVAVLSEVLQRVMSGERAVVERPLGPASRRANDESAELMRLANYLTQRELECLRLLATGRDTTSIAQQMGVSRTTVRTHVQSVLTKLGAHSRLEAASLAFRHGLLS
jgi:DNA-binding NarL/FixJ family response regulator